MTLREEKVSAASPVPLPASLLFPRADAACGKKTCFANNFDVGLYNLAYFPQTHKALDMLSSSVAIHTK